MASVAFMAPLLPRGAERLRDLAAVLSGPRLPESVASHRRLGLSMERWYLQATVRGDVVIVYLEGNDLSRAFQILAASRTRFDVWLKAETAAIHGIDFSRPPRALLP